MALSIEHLRRVPVPGLEAVRLPFRPPEKPSNQTERLDFELKSMLEKGHLSKRPQKILSAEVGDPVFTLHLKNQRDSGIIENQAYDVLRKYGWEENEFSVDYDHEESNSDIILQTAVHINSRYTNSVYELKHFSRPKSGERIGIEVYVAKKTPQHEQILLNRLPFPRNLSDFITEFSRPR